MDIIHERFLELTKPRGENKRLGEYLGLHPNTIGGWKSGLSQNYRQYIPQIAEFYGVNVAGLSGLSDDKFGHKKSAPAVSSKSDIRRLIDSYLDEFTEAEAVALLEHIKSSHKRQE